MKRCSSCKTEKPLETFGKDSTRTDNLCPECNTCRTARRAACSPEQKEKARHDAKVYWNNRLALVQDMKMSRGCENPECTTCGPLQPSSLHWHHIDASTKLFKMSQAGGKGMTSIYNEIAKCQVLCAPCHMELHKREKEYAS